MLQNVQCYAVGIAIALIAALDAFGSVVPLRQVSGSVTNAGRRASILVQHGIPKIFYLTTSACFVKRLAKSKRRRWTHVTYRLNQRRQKQLQKNQLN
jgi:hypothetical protein